MENVIKRIKKKHLVSRYLIMLVSLFISAIIYNLFIVPSNLVTGGTGGIAILTKYIYGFDNSIVILVTSSALLLLSFMYLGIEKTTATVVATFVYPLFVKITSPLVFYLIIEQKDMMIIAIFIGIISGLCNGFMYKTGFSNGGFQIISQILYKYFKISVSTTTFVINGIIVFIGGIFFGWTMVMYALIILYINSLIIDKVLLGISSNKAFYIITSEEDKVREFIIKELNHSVTIFDVKGAFLEKKRKVLLTVIPSREYFVVTEGIKMIDKEAFFLASDAYQVEGGK